jgi:hypothetical protein
LSGCTYMQLFKLKVVCILSGSNSSSSRADVLRDGWGTPRNQPQLVSMGDNNRKRFDTDESPEAA